MKDESGYAVVELLVAVSLALLITAFALSVYFVLMRQAERWRRGVALDNALHLTVRRLSDDLRIADTVLVASDGRYSIQSTSRDPVYYRLEDSVLARNDRPVHPQGVFTRDLNLQSDMDSGMALPLYHISATVTDGRRVLSAQTSIVPRDGLSWRPLSRLVSDGAAPTKPD